MPSEIPTGWQWTRIGEHFRRMTRKNTAGINRVLTASGQHGLVDQEEFFNKRVAAKNLSGYFHLKRGEFAYNRSSMKGYPCGAIKRLDRYDDGALSTLYLCLGLRPNAGITSDYAAQLFDSGQLNGELRPIARVGARAHGLLNVTPSDFMEVSFPLPPLPEQKKIAAILSSVDEAIQATQAVIEQTRRVKEGLLQDLLTRGIGHTRFKQTEIGEIPEGWTTGKLRTLGLVDCGKAKNQRQDAPLRPYLRVANVLDDEIKSSDVLMMPFSDEEFERYKLKPGDILLNEGQSLELVGRPAVYRGDPPNVAMQNALLRWRPDPAQVEPEFGYQIIQRLYRTGVFSQISTQTTSVAHLGLKRFRGIEIAVPPLPEQRRIAAVLSSADDLARRSQRELEQEFQLKSGLLQDLLTGKVRVAA